MKRKLSLVLAIAMLASCLLGLTAFAAENDTTENAISYKDVTIAYSNVSYIDEISLMFAVPVPADLPKDSSVSVIVWDEYSDELEFSYDETIADGDNDAPAKLIAANADTASINGVEHFVFEFKDFGPEKMTDVIYARSVIVDANGRRFYGDVITHSILKHVKTALGELRGFTGIADEDTKQLLRDLLDFGADAQDYYGGAAAYLPNGYYANDDVKQIWIVPVINGVEQDKVFGEITVARNREKKHTEEKNHE